MDRIISLCVENCTNLFSKILSLGSYHMYLIIGYIQAPQNKCRHPIFYSRSISIWVSLSVPVKLSLSPVGSVPDMTSEQFLSVEVTKNNASSLAKGVRILVVESDPTCVRIVSKMLQAFGYEGMCWRLVGYLFISTSARLLNYDCFISILDH